MLAVRGLLTVAIPLCTVAKAHEEAVKWIAANKGNAEMKNCDFIHNIATSAKEVTDTIMTLAAYPDVPIDELFTKASNCPVPAVSFPCLQIGLFPSVFSL